MEWSLRLRFNLLAVLESLGPSDWNTGTRLHQRVERLRTDSGATPPAALLAAPTLQLFDAWLYWLRRETLRLPFTPILHFESHGSTDGLHLADGAHISWADLIYTLRSCNIASRNNLLVVFAACDAIALAGPALSDVDRPAPFWAIVAPTGPVDQIDIERGFPAFYEQLFMGTNAQDAVHALNAACQASGATSFRFLPAELHFMQTFRAYIRGMARGRGRRRREEDLVSMLVKAHGSDDLPRMRQVVKQHLRKEEQLQLYREYRERFLMLREFPSEAERFPLDQSVLESFAYDA